MITAELRSQIVEKIGENLELEKCLILIFGSEALSESTPRSDIDLAVDCVEPIPDEVFLEIERKLNEEVDTLRRIDLVELRELDEEFLLFALKGAVIWHVGRDYLKSWIRRRELSGG